MDNHTKSDMYSIALDWMEAHGYKYTKNAMHECMDMYPSVNWTKDKIDFLEGELQFLKKSDEKNAWPYICPDCGAIPYKTTDDIWVCPECDGDVVDDLMAGDKNHGK